MIRKLIGALLCALVVSTASSANEDAKQAIARTYKLMDAYTQKLRPQHDPFATIFSLEPAKALFFRLKMREGKNGAVSPSPLAVILNAFAEYRQDKTNLDMTLVESVLVDAERVYATGSYLVYSKVDWQSNLIALQYLFDYLRRFVPAEFAPEEGDKADPKNPDKTKKKKDPAPKNKTKPKYPQFDKKYKPHTKDTEKDKEKGSKDDQVVVVEVNFETPLFGQRFFSEIVRGATTPFAEVDIAAASFSMDSRTRHTGKELVVKPLGESRMALFLPPNHRPLQPTDSRAAIVREKSGNYVLEIDTSNGYEPAEVTIPLEEGARERLGPHVLEVFKRKVGFDLSEWPSSVQLDVFAKFAPSAASSLDPLQVAQAIADHIATSYLYSVGERGETDPVAALNSGAFQCDMAAYAMVSILRDVYEIPSRVVGGFRAKKYRDGKDKKSFLVLPVEGHAWVEVYADGQWKAFDPTPNRKDKKDKKDKDEDGEKDEYSDRELDNTPKPPPEEENEDGEPGEPSDKESDKGEKGKNSAKERLKKDTEESLKRTGEAGKNETSAEKDPSAMDINELADLLEIGSLEMEPKPNANPLLNRAYRVLIQIILDPNNDSKAIHTALNAMASIYKGINDPGMRALFAEAQLAHQSGHKPLASWLKGLSATYKELEVPKIYNELFFAKKVLDVYAHVLDENGSIQKPQELRSALSNALDEVARLAHKDSPRIAMVDAFHRSLPGLVQELLSTDYGMSRVGDDQATRSVATALEKGELNHLRLLGELTPVSNFILDSVPRPEYEEVRTWTRDSQRRSGNELLPLQRYSEMARSLLLQPWASLERNLQDGTVFVPAYKQRVSIPTGFGNDDSERITIVVYDVSGSMQGDPEEFQAALIGAFTARALGDVSLSGRNRHKVVLLPFDDKVGTPRKVSTSQEAITLIRKFNTDLTGPGGGTDIQGALIQALALIADAEKRAGEPLAAANILLMTDGEAEVDIEKLAEARNAIDRETPIQTMFVAIGNSNDKLLKFAMESRSAGFNRGFYEFFTSEHMKDLMDASKGPLKEKTVGQIYSKYDASTLTYNFDQVLNRAAVLAQELGYAVRSGSRFEAAETHYKSIPWRNHVGATQDESVLDGWLEGVRRFAFNEVFSHRELKDKRLLERVVDDLMKHFALLTHKEVRELSLREEAHLHHLLSRAAGKDLGEGAGAKRGEL